MAPFYSDLIAHYFKAVASCQFEFSPEDVYIFKALSELFKCKTQNGVTTTLDGMFEFQEFSKLIQKNIYYKNQSNVYSVNPFFDQKFWDYTETIANRMSN